MTPVFFTDRDLGHLFPQILHEARVRVEEHADHFSHDTRDEDWLTEVAVRGWFCLTRDKRIRYKPNERNAAMRSGAGLFILIGRTSHRELANNFVNTLRKVERFIQNHRYPFIAKIYRPLKKSKSPSGTSGTVKLWLSYDEWLNETGG